MIDVPERGARGAGIAYVLAASLSLLVVAPAGHAQQVATTSYVAARTLARGAVIALEDVRAIDSPRGNPRPAPRAPVVGWVTKRVIAPGEPLRAPSIAPPNVIESGQPVAVVWREPGIEVRLKGVAANAAALGDRVTVRVDVRRRLEGVAVAPGLVQIQ
jgi:flagella basal body P-ring formation protein FlgA